MKLVHDPSLIVAPVTRFREQGAGWAAAIRRPGPTADDLRSRRVRRQPVDAVSEAVDIEASQHRRRGKRRRLEPALRPGANVIKLFTAVSYDLL
jgi:hypothetical protein